jgi:tRNA/rRNA methyltransferase
MPLKNIRVVLLRPRGAANVGAVARAMKNMGLDDLVLVRPALVRAFWSKAMAVHAEDVLRRVRRCDSLGEAVADCGLVVGTTCRGGLYRGAAEPLRQVAPRIIAAAGANRVALVFGPEDHGLSNEDLKRCQQLIVIPADLGYPSLNLAQAVMVCGYELFLAASSTAATPRVLAPTERVEMVLQRLQAAFLAIGYLHRDNPDHIMFAFRRLLGRAQMEERDVRILLALARQIEWFGREGWRKVAAGEGPHPGPFDRLRANSLPGGEGEGRRHVGEKF